MNKKWIAVIVILVLLITAAVVIAAVLQPEDTEKELTFAEFLEMTPAEQQAYMESYEDITDFLEWYRRAEETYKAEQTSVEVGGNGDIDIGDFIN